MTTDNWWWVVVAIFWVVACIASFLFNHGAHKDDADDDSY